MAAADQLVAIGASAGGLEPLQEFFDAMPADTGMAFVVVQHLSPDHPSLMDELLARHTKMRVARAEHGMDAEPNTVYVIQPKKYLRILHGQFQLTDQAREREKPPTPIDVFFESMAEDYAERGAAIVLSGTGSDGSRGIRVVREAGGRTIAQDVTAKFDGMPRAAIETDSIDMILPPTDMPSFLMGNEDEEGIRPSLVNTTPGVYEVLEVLRERHGIDFAQYKITTVLRRIERRVQLTHATSVRRYLDELERSEEEQDRL
ncbi:MAG: chemotaxis protein CheB, partial [Planctomycetota bacterium]